MQAVDLHLSYCGVSILEGVSFTLQKGEKCALIGRNGSGKSTLFKLLLGSEKADKGVVSLPKGYRIGHLQQHIHFTKSTLLEETCLGLKEEEKDATYKAEKMLLGLGFSQDQYELAPESFSGGYQLRIQLAKVLLSDPDCLLLDEPTNYLDILSVRFLSKFLKQWPGEMILISHDLEFLDETTTHMMSIHRKKAQKIKGKSSDLFSLIAQEEELYEKTRMNLEKKKAHLEAFVERFGAKASKATQAQSKQKALDKIPSLEKLKNIYNLEFSFKEEPFMGKKMLQANTVSFSYDKVRQIVRDFSLAVEKRDRIAIIGKNGYGKSTLLKLLAQESSPDQGSVDVSAAVRLGYFGQTNIDKLDRTLTIEEEVSRANPKLNFTEVRGICGLMMFGGDLAKKQISVLSGGEKSRVLLGKIIAKPCNLLFLDEPTHHLDIESIEALIDAIEEFDGSCVVVTHSEWMLKRIPFTKLIVCHKDKQEIFDGSYEEFLEKLGWQEEKDVKKEEKKSFERPKNSSVKSQIKKCEDKIVLLEERIDLNNNRLAEMSPLQSKEIKEILAAIEKDQDDLNECYNLLSDLYQKI
ncbi:MAG: ABC-F family ATP-binding cassette domain-containing protein [Chlamydiae bacterium]|nr:ABC-F family ATP-binding cassette domain-containing protein [Chlamydiota bacterium]